MTHCGHPVGQWTGRDGAPLHKWEGDACRRLAARSLALADQASGQTPFTRTRLGKRSAGENRYSLAWRGPTGTMIWTYGVPFHIT
jgi:hypothetical protein